MTFFVVSARRSEKLFRALRLIILSFEIMVILLSTKAAVFGKVRWSKRYCQIGDSSRRSDCIFVYKLCPLCLEEKERKACYRFVKYCFGKNLRVPNFQYLPRSTRSSLTDQCSQNQIPERVTITACTGLRAVMKCKTKRKCVILNKVAIYELGKKISLQSKPSAKFNRKKEIFNRYRLRISCRGKEFRRQKLGMQVLHATSSLPSTARSTDKPASQAGTPHLNPTIQHNLAITALRKLATAVYVLSVTTTTENTITERMFPVNLGLIQDTPIILDDPRSGCHFCSGVSGGAREPFFSETEIQETSSVRRRVIRDALTHLIKKYPRIEKMFNVPSCRWKKHRHKGYDISCLCRSAYL